MLRTRHENHQPRIHSRSSGLLPAVLELAVHGTCEFLLQNPAVLLLALFGQKLFNFGPNVITKFSFAFTF